MTWLPRSLAVRATLLLGLIACAVTGVLGAYFFYTARTAVMEHLDTQLIGRVEHFRRLVGNVQTIADLHDRPLLFETMLGAENDVLLLRRPGEAPFIDVNPAHFPVPGTLAAAAPERELTVRDVLRIPATAAMPMHWVAALARSGRDGDMVEVVAGHPLTNEVRMIRANRDRVVFGAIVAMLASTLLAYLVLRHGLRPLRRVAAKAALINPINLAMRLPEHDAPREVQHMVVAFNAMLDRIATGYERLSQFSADLAHETRTPIGALIGQTQVALHRARSVDEYQHLLESNLEELNRLRLIAENILFLAQADHAALTIERAPLGLHDELRKIADYFEGPAEERGIRFDVQASGTAFVNATLCRRAVNNLVVNAVRYGAEGTKVRLIGVQDGDTATIAVENEGSPVPPEQLARLFDRFYRGDAARSRDTESNGLGLAIVKAIMVLHGGEACATSPTPGSIRFELHFPAHARA
ncbi:heavy metal sensor histidine kinase [Variovorax sp. PBL-E5]|uniref:heavy metal sensor histidine kinase n=1 Tax=Variovorax sp. PBL-E5 TaxID=434014 RepID=UPI001316CF27|nr:heavy metal sensor histidine kinase [Variovorax sp. PBL-E5]VTU28684.1 Sensor protein CzcS precursor [Variovorax sp. PBL-E5]